MNRKMDWPALLLFATLLFGAVVRFWPGMTNGFPLNDGGMFYTMIGDLKANHYLLPEFTKYNTADIPFAYPPFGFYAAAFLSGLLPVSEQWILTYLPALINTLSILAFYKLAEKILHSRIAASLAVMVYAFTSASFLWQVMGGGITRAFGMSFLLLFLWQAMELFTEGQNKSLIYAILFGAGAVLSHPQTALHAALGGAIIFLFYGIRAFGWSAKSPDFASKSGDFELRQAKVPGINKRGIVHALITAAGVMLVAAPWWATVLSRHGMGPFLFANQTSPRTLDSYLSILKFGGLDDYLFIPAMFFIVIGLWKKFTRRDAFLVTWGALAVLLDPRGGEGITQLTLILFAGMGLQKLSAWISRSDGEQAEVMFAKRGVQSLIFGFLFYSVMGASIFDFMLVNTSLKNEDLKMIEWVNANVEDGKTFLLSTGREFSMSDPMQEWFPALTNQYSATTMQGLEWTLGEKFFPWYDQLIAFQHCADIPCVNEWSASNRVDYDYLIVTIPSKEDESAFAKSLRSLAVSARGSALHLLAYESENALVFEFKK